MKTSARSNSGVAGTAMLFVALACAGPAQLYAAAVSGAESAAASGGATDVVVGDVFPAGGVVPEGWILPSGANAGWSVASDSAFEGALSLRSDPVGNGQTAGIEVSGTFAAGTLSFARRVSSEADYDVLRFYVDGALQQEWSGDTGWAVAAYGMLAGSHTFRWEYAKDAAVSAGTDAAWIDAVVLPPRSTTPTFAFGAAEYWVDESTASLTIAVHRSGSTAGAASVSYATANGTALAGADYAAASGRLDFAVGETTKTIALSVAGDAIAERLETFTVMLSNPSAGAVLGSPSTTTVTIADDDDAFPPGATLPADWAKPQDAATGWTPVRDAAWEGSWSLKSDAIGDRQSAAIEVTGRFVAGTVTFARKLSSEPDFDQLRFYVDGALLQQWSGETDWAVAGFDVAAGVHTFRWEYAKDESFSVGADAAWIDAVVLPATAGDPPRLVSVVSRKAHAAAGTFDLPLASTPASPTTEPRAGPAHTIAFAFDKPVVGGTASVVEGAASVGAPTFEGSEMRVPLTGVANAQYVTVTVSNVTAADGGSGAGASVRIGFLLGDTTQNRVVTVSDLAQVNAAIAQVVTASNYLKDVNASGTLTVADKGIANTQITKALPTP